MDREDGWRLYEHPGAGRAVFCRLEHVVPWSIQGPRWDPEPAPDAEAAESPPGGAACAHCETPLGDVWLSLTRHRAGHRIADWFCSVDHAAAWAKAGGRWR